LIKKAPAYPLYLATQGGFWFCFHLMATISAVYRVQSAGLNPFQLVLVGTVLESAVLLFEIPTGVVADLISRRLSVVIGYILIGLGFILEGSFPLFWTILLAQVTWGIGATFTSGAEEAWLADELGEERLTAVYLRGSQMAQIGTLAGIIASVGLATISLNTPIVAGGAGITVLGLLLALFMPERGFRPAPAADRSSWQNAGSTLRKGLSLVRGRRVLILMMAVALVYGLSSEGLDRLWEAHFLANFTFPQIGGWPPVIWFGFINAGQLLLAMGGIELVRRRLKSNDQASALTALAWISVAMVLSQLLLGLAWRFPVAVGAVWGVFTFRRMSFPLFAAWINKGLKSETRATVLSMRGQADALGQLAGGPIMGAVGNWISLRWAMIGVGILLAPVIFLYMAARRLIRAGTPAASPV